MNRNTVPFESLESRTLMSATFFDSAVQHDRAVITADFVKLRINLNTDAKAILTDNKALRKDDLKANTVLEPLVLQFRSDVKSFQLTLKSDRLTEAGNVIADEKVILGERVQAFRDRHNATALAADQALIITDRAQLNTDEVAGLTQRLSDRQAEAATLQTDAQAILTALPTSGASAQLTADVQTWLGDKGANLDRITGDLTKISTDRTQLIADLNAE
jgi:hypothetical protein